MEAVSRPRRQDAARNRELLIATARQLLAGQGPAIALESVAQAAGVSRTTLYRNFQNRHELIVTVLGDNVTRIETEASRLQDRPDGIVALLRFVLDMQQGNRSIGQILATESDVLLGLGERTTAAFAPLVRTGLAAGIVQPGVSVADFMLALLMAQATVREEAPGEPEPAFQRARRLLFRALFTGVGLGPPNTGKDG